MGTGALRREGTLPAYRQNAALQTFVSGEPAAAQQKMPGASAGHPEGCALSAYISV
jgi:hypothetical protein